VGGHPEEKKLTYWFTRCRHKVYRTLAKRREKSAYWQQRAIIRCYDELKNTALSIHADLYVAHNAGALAPAALAAQKNQSLYAFDGEDFHRGEFPEASFFYSAIVAIENKYLPGCRYFTAASPLIAAAYQQYYPEKNIVVINNVFSRDFLQPVNFRSDNVVNLFWFSQTVGANRGLETVVQALNELAGYNFRLHILGHCPDSYRDDLIRLSNNASSLNFISPVSLQEIFEIASRFDIGLATEVPYCENRNICLTNKLFIYLLSGNCIVASNTDAQQQFMDQYSGIGLLYKNHDVQDLAAQFRQLFDNRQLLKNLRLQANVLADNELNWEKESGILMKLVHSLWEKG
jgi:glycosyltransferase involved in cell wall biosynthesis